MQGFALRLKRRDLRQFNRLIEQYPQFPRNPQMGEQIRAVGSNFQIKNGVFFAVQGGNVRPQGEVFVQYQNAVCPRVRKAQFVRRANHPFRSYAADNGRLHNHSAQAGAHTRQRDFLPHGNIGGPAYYALGFAAAQIQIHQVQVVGIGVVFYVGNLGHRHALKIGPGGLHAGNFYAQMHKLLDHFFGG